MQVSATDADIRSNAEITYTLFGSGSEKFTLNPNTGNYGLWGKCNCVFPI
jgi:protocadherin Fat 1/2/3